MNFEITAPTAEINVQWFIDLLTRIISELFAWLKVEEGWEDAE